jgi:hypothetical protein
MRTLIVPVSELSLDPKNYRSIPQPNEVSSVRAMIATDPGRFWGLFDSLIEDGYLPNENIVVLKVGQKKVVMEGNRRVAILKILTGQIAPTDLPELGDHISEIAGLTAEWVRQNSSVPCTVYEESDEALVDKIVSRVHGKADKAGRANWLSIARARHNRDKNGATEPELDLFEKFLDRNSELSDDQKLRWQGQYPITVLEEAMKRVAPKLGCATSVVLAAKYPNVSHKRELDEIILAVGRGSLGYAAIRGNDEWYVKFGIPTQEKTNPTPPQSPSPEPTTPSAPSTSEQTRPTEPGEQHGQRQNAGHGNDVDTATPPEEGKDAGGKKTRKVAAVPLEDPRAIKRALKKLKIYGTDSGKIESLRIEAHKLNLETHPTAFCFLLRSLFELSAKAYAAQNEISLIEKDGRELTLAKTLKKIVEHLTQQGREQQMQKKLHGAIEELAIPNGILSITSMNQLVHNLRYVSDPAQIPVAFARVFPLLEEMNQ